MIGIPARHGVVWDGLPFHPSIDCPTVRHWRRRFVAACDRRLRAGSAWEADAGAAIAAGCFWEAASRASGRRVNMPTVPYVTQHPISRTHLRPARCRSLLAMPSRSRAAACTRYHLIRGPFLQTVLLRNPFACHRQIRYESPRPLTECMPLADSRADSWGIPVLVHAWTHPGGDPPPVPPQAAAGA